MRRSSPSVKAADTVTPTSSRLRTRNLKLESVVEPPEESRGPAKHLWETALQRAMESILDNQPKAARALLRECDALCSLTIDLPLCKQQFADLAKEISASASSATSEMNWLRLSSILSRFAPRC